MAIRTWWKRTPEEELELDKIYQRIVIKRNVKIINRMLSALKKSDLYDESIAVENLFNYLKSPVVNVKRTKTGGVSVVGLKSKSITQLTGITKALNDFMKNKTSTVSGMKALYDERIDELKRYMDESFVEGMSTKDIRTLYRVFQSNSYERIQSRMDSKSFFTIYTQSIDEKWSREKFIRELNHYIDFGEDMDLKEDLISIYDSYIDKVGK